MLSSPELWRAEPTLTLRIFGRDLLFADLERALDAIEFLGSRSRTSTLRSLRVALYRAQMDVREASLIRAVFIEVRKFLHRRGVLSEVGPVGSVRRGPADGGESATLDASDAP